MNITEISLDAFEKFTDTTGFIKGKITLQEYDRAAFQIKTNEPADY